MARKQPAILIKKGVPMKKLLLPFLLVFAACATTPTPAPAPSPAPAPAPLPPTVGCAIAGVVAGAGASLIASNGACAYPDAIRASILAAVPPAFCPTVAASKQTLKFVRGQKGVKFNEKGIIGNIACPMLVNSLGAGLMGKVPPTWGCSGGVALSTAEGWLTTTCEKNISM